MLFASILNDRAYSCFVLFSILNSQSFCLFRVYLRSANNTGEENIWVRVLSLDWESYLHENSHTICSPSHSLVRLLCLLCRRGEHAHNNKQPQTALSQTLSLCLWAGYRILLSNNKFVINQTIAVASHALTQFQSAFYLCAHSLACALFILSSYNSHISIPGRISEFSPFKVAILCRPFSIPETFKCLAKHQAIQQTKRERLYTVKYWSANSKKRERTKQIAGSSANLDLSLGTSGT